jgi:hypothetical protein
LSLNSQHDHDDQRGKRRQDHQIHSSQLIVGSARVAVAGRTSFGVGGVTVERGDQLRVPGIEITLSQRLGLSCPSAPVEGWGRHPPTISETSAVEMG